MAYRAYINNEIFFATDIDQDELRLVDAPIDLEAGASGEFDFILPPCNTAYGRINKFIDDITVYENGNLIFAGRPYYIDSNFGMNMTVKCEGYLTVLNDSVARPFTYTGDLEGLVEEFITSHNEQVDESKRIQIGRITVQDDYLAREYTVHAKTIERISTLVDNYGGYPIIRKENNTRYFDWLADFTEVSSQAIDFGENLLNIRQVEDGTGIATVLIPLGAEIEDETTGEHYRITIESVNNGLDYIENASAVHTFGRIVTYEIWDDVTVPAILLNKGRERLDKISEQKLQITVTAADLANAGYDVDNFHIGTKVPVTAARHNIENKLFTCLRISFNLLRPGQKKLTMNSVAAGYIKINKDAQSQYNRLIEKVVSNYATNTALQNVSNTLNTKIEYNTTLIGQNAQAISLKADASVVDAYGRRISAAESELQIQAGQIALKASQADVNAMGTRITSVETDLDAAEAAITLKADQTVVDALGTRVSSAEADIDANAAAITLKADSATVDALGTRLAAAELKITDSAIISTVLESDLYVQSVNTINLLPAVYQSEAQNGKTFEQNGITWTLNADGSITATGTATANSIYELTANNLAGQVGLITIDPDKKYTLHGIPEDVSSANAWLVLYRITSSGGMTTATGKTLTAGPGYKYLGARISIKNGYECPSGGITFYPMLETGDTAHSYVSSHDGTGTLTSRLITAESNIAQNAAAISLKASQASLDAMGTRVTTVEETLDAQAGVISQKVSTSDYNGETIASLINQSASTVLISAAHIDLEGTVQLSAFDAASKALILSNAEAKTQFYLSSSSTALENGEWTDSVPQWESGKYIWTRTVTVKTDAAGTSSQTETAGVYDKNTTAALMQVATAQSSADAANAKLATLYGTCATAAGTAAKVVACGGFSLYRGATITVYFSNANTAANPTLNVNNTGAKPIYAHGTAITAPYYWQATDSVTFTYNGTAWIMSETSAASVLAAWCYNNDRTYINGGMLATGTVTAEKIYVTDLYALGATIGGWSINASGIYKHSVMTTGTAGTQYQVFIHAPATIANNTTALYVRQRTYDGSSYGSWTNNCYLRYDGYFYCNNVNVKGTINATSLTLGDGVSIAYSKLSGAPDLTVYISKGGKVGNTPASGATGFVVSTAGLLQASNAIIWGTIYASSGTIGGMTLDSNSIHSGTWGSSGSVMLCTGTSTKKSIGGSGSISGWAITAGAAFGVTTAGAVYCSNISITGGTISVTVSSETANYITLKYSTNRATYYGVQFLSFEYASSPSVSNKAWYGPSSALLTQGSASHTASSGWTSQMQLTPDMVWGRKTTSGLGTKSWYLDFITTTGYVGYSRCIADYIYANVAYSNPSDRRKKQNIRYLDIEKSAALINAMKPASFEYIEAPNTGIHRGLVAQDAEQVISALGEDWRLITEDENGYKYLSYTELIADLIGAVQYLSQELAAVKAKIA